MKAPLEMVHAVNRDDVCTGPFNPGTHLVQQGGHVDDLRFLGRVLDRGPAFGIDGRHHDVDGRPDGRDIQEDLVPDELISPDRIAAAVILHLGSECLKALDMQVDRPRPQVAPARHLDPYIAVLAQQRAHKVIRSPQLGHDIVIEIDVPHIRRIDDQMAAAVRADFHVEQRQDPGQRIHIIDIRHADNRHRPAGQHRRRNECHGRILRPGDGHFPAQPPAASYLNDFLHGLIPPQYMPAFPDSP